MQRPQSSGQAQSLFSCSHECLAALFAVSRGHVLGPFLCLCASCNQTDMHVPPVATAALLLGRLCWGTDSSGCAPHTVPLCTTTMGILTGCAVFAGLVMSAVVGMLKFEGPRPRLLRPPSLKVQMDDVVRMDVDTVKCSQRSHRATLQHAAQSFEQPHVLLRLGGGHAPSKRSKVSCASKLCWLGGWVCSLMLLLLISVCVPVYACRHSCCVYHMHTSLGFRPAQVPLAEPDRMVACQHLSTCRCVLTCATSGPGQRTQWCRGCSICTLEHSISRCCRQIPRVICGHIVVCSSRYGRGTH
jgi:hypothetical protein